jgi:hypothetical protein
VFAIALAGIVAGTVHVLSGPDHLTAVAPFAIRSRGAAWRAGAKWGVGHTGGVAVLAAIALAFRELLPLDRISAVSEQLVGVVLIGIGLWTLRLALQSRVHVHAHEHDGERHVHMHLHGPASAHASRPGSGPAPAHDHSHAPLYIGILHGAAGTSHIFGILPALALPTRTDAVTYLAGYGMGTITAMVGFAAALGAVSMRTRGDGGRLYRSILAGAGAAAVVVGLVWLVP